MKNLLIFFVTAPAWKIFLLLLMPFVLSATIISISTPGFILNILILLGLWTTLLWIYSVGILIYEKYSTYLSIPIYRFKICIIYDFLYSIVFAFGVIPFEFLFPLHTISIICNIYALYFISKLIVIVEIKGDVKFTDYVGTMIAAWVFIIGIWFLQPRVNSIFSSNDL